jgi:hypothetical protein
MSLDKNNKRDNLNIMNLSRLVNQIDLASNQTLELFEKLIREKYKLKKPPTK